MMKRMTGAMLVLWGLVLSSGAGPLIIDHEDVDIAQLTESEINRAKSVLHIGYGHTSHGSQLTDGMNGLVGFANGGGKGLNLSSNIFAWNNGGSGGALDLEEGDGYGNGWLDHDCGYWPNWYDETVSYLNDASHTDVNVIVWSWCGQMPGKWSGGTLTNEYLAPMTSLETTFPDVVFVYMTGHVDMGNDANQKGGAQAIRDYCIANDKVLYDFADIEHYNPDGTYFEFVGDDCAYYTNAGSGCQGNWATAWQDSHTEDVDWYNCGSAHSQPLNANQKAYAAWALWCALAADMDRDEIDDTWEEQHGGTAKFSGGTNDYDHDGATDWSEYIADTDPTNAASRFDVDQITVGGGCHVAVPCSASRVYNLYGRTNLLDGAWTPVSGQTRVPGEADGSLELEEDAAAPLAYYRVGVEIP